MGLGLGSFIHNPLIALVSQSFITCSSLFLDCLVSAVVSWAGVKDAISPLRTAVTVMTHKSKLVRQTTAVSPGEDLNLIQIYSWTQNQFTEFSVLKPALKQTCPILLGRLY